MITTQRLEQIDNFADMAKFFYDELNWPVAEWKTFEGIARLYDIPPADIPGVVSLSAVQPFPNDPQPWGIFLVEYGANALKRSELRQILNRVAERARQSHDNPTWPHENILFVVHHETDRWTLGHFRGDRLANVQLRTIGWTDPEFTRTLRERNLPELAWSNQKNWENAWNAEKLTQDFFDEYSRLFSEVEAKVTGLEGDLRRRFTQALFNRLMFLCFLQQKGWLEYPAGSASSRRRYLFSLFETNPNDFYDRLKLLFFSGLNSQNELGGDRNELQQAIGRVPFLNGGLFEPDFQLDAVNVTVSDDAFAAVLGPEGLFRRYTFTVTESTPMDIEVALDPEMLGKIFEELVTDRHPSGAYYTPRPVVAFMCREAIKGFLGGGEAVRKFVDDRDPVDLINPEATLEDLRSMTVCDLACGSGAYLVGMLQELIELRHCLFREHRIDPATDFQRKLETISHSIYGVDLDEFAIQIAWLRLWLTLVIEDTRNPLDQPNVDVSLPNLDAKVEVGDSVIGPDPSGGPQPDLLRDQQIQEFELVKSQYLRAHGAQKRELGDRLSQIRQDIAAWAHASQRIEGFDWRVEFAEVFRNGGFDIVLANPPYVRQEIVLETMGRDYKNKLIARYPDSCVGKSDLYCYFYARALQLLNTGGMHVFVCSNSWLDVGFGARLQRHLLVNSTINAIYDSAIERQFATADINTIISVVQKGRAEETHPTEFVSLRAPFEEAVRDRNCCRIVVKTRQELWDGGTNDIHEYEGDKWGGKYLRAPDVYWRIMERAGDRLIRLADIAPVRRGFTTGANDFFYVRVLVVQNGIARIRCDDGSEHNIEAEYVREPALVKAREIVRPNVRVSDLQYRLVRLDEAARSRRHAREYIEWGEASRTDDRGNEIGEFHERPSTRSRRPWYSINVQGEAAVAFPAAHKRRAVIASLYQDPVQIDKRLYGVYPHDRNHAPMIAMSLISTFSTLCREVHGRANFGQGVLELTVYEAEDLPTINPVVQAEIQRLSNAFEALADRTIQMIYDEVRNPDRRALDDAFLEAVGFEDPNERLEVLEELHDAACRMVWTRQAKAPRTRESRQSYDDWLATGEAFGNVEEGD